MVRIEKGVGDAPDFFYTKWEGVASSPKLGGPKVSQQHVDILQEEGFEARMVLDGKRSWFSRLGGYEQTIAITGKKFRKEVGPSDIVVVPAITSPEIESISGDHKVLMVQNGGLLFNAYPLEDETGYPWHNDVIEAIICVSEADRHLLEMCQPTCPVYRVYNRVDPNRFDPLPWEKRDDSILATTPRPYKNPWHTAIVCHAIRSRTLADNQRSKDETVPSVRVIRGLAPSELTSLMIRAKLLVFPSMVEGFSLLALEAAVAGTPVIEYRNQPLEEYMPDFYLHEIGDFEAMVTTAEEILSADTDDRLHEHRTTALEAARD